MIDDIDELKLLLASNTTTKVDWKSGNKRFFIYGTGSVARDVFSVLTNAGIRVVGFIDHRVTNQQTPLPVPVYFPDSSDLLNKENLFVILAIHNREVDISVLLQRLRSFGYREFLTMIDLYDHFSLELGNRYWLADRGIYPKYFEKIISAYGLLSDKLSQEIFLSTIKFRITGNYDYLSRPDMANQYFPSDIDKWTTPLRLVDCGAFDGDIIRFLFDTKIPIEALAAFEPDLKNFQKLVKTVQKYPTLNACLWPCGIHSATTQLSFSKEHGEASQLTVTGDSLVQCIKLDEAIPGFRPNLIKMDIEGAEYEAILGAEQIISNYHPGLAISIYHTPEHHWDILFLINTMAHKYGLRNKYFIRSHAYNTFDTVLYVIPMRGTN